MGKEGTVNDPIRSDVAWVRRRLATLITAIVLALAVVLWLTFHLYARWTAGASVTP